jgi:hypothetical protein
MRFFSGEGPRSRRYGRTAALRLLVQTCDEDDMMMMMIIIIIIIIIIILSFS